MSRREYLQILKKRKARKRWPKSTVGGLVGVAVGAAVGMQALKVIGKYT